MRIELWNRLRPGDMCEYVGLQPGERPASVVVKHVLPAFHGGPAMSVIFARPDNLNKTRETTCFAAYRLHPDTLLHMTDRLIAELVEARNTPMGVPGEGQQVPSHASNIRRLAFELRLPKPGDELPFTVWKEGRLRLSYNATDGYLHAYNGDCQNTASPYFLADVFGIPAQVSVCRTVTVASVGTPNA